ncbi:type II toxin-antitoxin system ParD family antitoxin [Methylobacterium sp. EM32]|uniref:type II toxin-antitoxin system ParD family antitoxin n=1 Tax=Methylobacterium sp. EM32 TaxID=3163481 RepID=UPI0033BF36A1
MAAVESITVDLPSDIAEFVRQAVEAGEYASTSEAIGDAVRLWKQHRNVHDDTHGYSIEELRELVREGLESGPSQWDSMAEIKAEARRRWEASAPKVDR